jgi:hypothetical protein
MLSFCLMLGTASLPHVLMRYFTTPSVKKARRSVAWSLFFILGLYLTAPALAAFVKNEVYTKVIGSQFGTLPKWVSIYGNIDGLVKVCGKAAGDTATIVAACNAKYSVATYNASSLLYLKDFQIEKVHSLPRAEALSLHILHSNPPPPPDRMRSCLLPLRSLTCPTPSSAWFLLEASLPRSPLLMDFFWPSLMQYPTVPTPKPRPCNLFQTLTLTLTQRLLLQDCGQRGV